MKKSFIKETLKLIVESALIVVILINFVLIPCVVDGSSMVPNLREGQFGYSFIITKHLGISRFDIVVIKPDANSNKLIVKRVIGLPGEKISYCDNKLYINGEYVEENFLGDVTTDSFEETLSDNEYFCLGDNRNVSRDSRYYGPFTKNEIVSSHLLVIYPFDAIGFRK